jgi:hypothetical protein
MNRRTCMVSLLLLVGLSGAAAQSVQNEGLVRTLGPGWTGMYEISPDLRYDAIELVPAPSSFKDWKEVVRIEDFVGASNESADDLLKHHQAVGEKRCPGTMHWSVISSDETGVVYQWHSDVCGKIPEEDAVGRVILGKYSRYMLEYSARVHELAPETRAHWMKFFADATFDAVTPSLDSAWMSVDVDEPVAFSEDKVMAALEAGMQSLNCKVSDKVTERIECKRARVTAFGSKEPDLGGESITAVLEPHGPSTQVHITTGKGFVGHMSKKNWSTPVFEAMMKQLQGSPR